MKVLIVDDSQYMRLQIRDILTDAGLTVVAEAENGEQAIDLAIEYNPDVITLDNILPDMIGLDILKILKTKMSIDSKIIMVSGVGQESVILEGKALGASDYIVKPFTTENIIESINNAVEMSNDE